MASPERFDRGYAWLLAGVASWFGAWGMQQVLLPWLVVNVLQESATRTGVVQMATMLPSMLLLPFGGAVADRVDARKLLAALHAVSLLPPLALALAFGGPRLDFSLLIACALAGGLVNGFANPSRDSLLSRVAGGTLTRAVAGVITVQFFVQGAGMLVAREADAIGGARALVAQGLCIAVGALFCAGLPGPASGGVPRPPRAPLRAAELLAGARFVWASPLRAIWPLVAGVGLFFSGVYNVLFPVMVRDLYGGGVSEIGLLLFAFPLGTIFASAWLFLRGIRRKGAALVLSLCAGALTVIGAGLEIRFEALVALTFVWGLAGGVFMTTGRALFQERAPAAERARILAVHQLAMVASGPIGALLSGALGDALGPSRAVLVQGVAMLGLIALVLSRSSVWRME